MVTSEGRWWSLGGKRRMKGPGGGDKRGEVVGFRGQEKDERARRRRQTRGGGGNEAFRKVVLYLKIALKSYAWRGV